ncbi:MAG TPA: amidohydrolase family protein [Gaiellaceae bacterium]|jgi:N-acetylglucosamine-6-phosphate deacetylase
MSNEDAPRTLEGLLVDPIVGVRPGALAMEGDLIVAVEERDAAAEQIVFPGFVDLHVYEPGPVIATGVTGYLQTAQRPVETSDPLCLGLHLEGPFLNPESAGALPVESLLPVDLDLLGEWLGRGDVRLVTVAPELDRGLDAISAIAERAVAAVGHTHANEATTRAAIDAGARFATHLWNAMAPLRARETGPATALLLDERVTIGLIGDGVHLHPTVEALTIRTAGSDRVALTSDRVAQPVSADNRLQGGSLSGAELVARFARFGLPAAAAMASLVPSRVMGLTDRGRLEPGYRADLAVLDGALRPMETIAAGKTVWALRYPETQKLDEIPPSTHAPGSGA